MVDMPLLEGIGLCSSSIILLLGTVRCIVPLVVAFEAEHLGDVPPGFSMWTRMPIVVVVDDMSIPLVPRVSRMISTESTIVVAMGFVAAFPMVIMSTMVRISSMMIVSAVMMVMVMGGVLLERGFRMMLVDSKLPLSVLSLLQTIIQDDSLVQPFLIVGSVSNGQRDPKFII